MSEFTPALLEIVPWSYGFAHSWAAKWLLEDSRTCDLLIKAAVGARVAAGIQVSNVETEYRLRGARADLAFELKLVDDRRYHVAFETKVNDPLKIEQLESYDAAGLAALLFFPGATGILHRNDQRLADRWRLDGSSLSEALTDVDLPWIISSYLDELRREGTWLQQVIADITAGAPTIGAGDHNTPPRAARAAAWLSTIQGLIQARKDADEWGRTSTIRVTANDRGLMWDGAWQAVDDADGRNCELVLEFIAEVHVDRWSLNIKVYGSAARDTLQAVPRAQLAPDSDRNWKRRRRLGTGTVWSVDLSALPVHEALAEGEAAADWMAAVATEAKGAPNNGPRPGTSA